MEEVKETYWKMIYLATTNLFGYKITLDYRKQIKKDYFLSNDKQHVTRYNFFRQKEQSSENNGCYAKAKYYKNKKLKIGKYNLQLEIKK